MKKHLPTVLIITTKPWSGGGAEQQVIALARGIDKTKFQVLLVSLNDDGTVPQQIPQVEYFHLNRKGKYDFLPMLRMMKILIKKRVDIIQPFLSPATLFGLVPAFLVNTRVKVVTERCGLRTKKTPGYKVTCMVEDLFGHFAQAAVANSIAGQDMLKGRGYKPEKTSVIYNGLDISRLEADPVQVAKIQAETGLNPDKPVVGISAWIIPAKDHVTFLKSAGIILKHKPEVQFAIMGDGPLVPGLKTLTNELGITKQVFFLGAQNQVGNYLHFFDMLVSSSVDHEGCSNSILEAMYLGKPIVATDVGGNKELVTQDENGFLIPPKEHEAMAQAILTLLNNPEKAHQMGEKGRARVLAEFSQEQMVTYYQDLWLNLLGKKAQEKA